MVPRLLAELASAVPLKDASTVMSGGSAVIVAALAVVVFRASAGVIASVPVRLALAASMILLPASGWETLDNAANLHWYLIFAAFWALLWRPSSRTEAVVAAAVVAGAALSDPLTVVLAPVVLVRWMSLPGRRQRWLCVTYGMALAVQLALCLRGEVGPALTLPPAWAPWPASSACGWPPRRCWATTSRTACSPPSDGRWPPSAASSWLPPWHSGSGAGTLVGRSSPSAY